MSYIRTKDGRIIAFGEKYAYPTRCSNGKTYFSFQELTEDRFEVMKEYNHWEIQNQSDNLEELCDCFIGELDGRKVILEKWNGNKFVIRWEINMISMMKNLNKTYKNVKGAIWTDKGLIYVAKMNDKGELELI